MKRSLWMGLAAAVVAALAVGAAWPPPPIPRGKQDQATWSLPPAAELARYSEDNFTKAFQSVHWEGDSALGSDASSEWRLAGISTDPAPVALIQPKDGKLPLRIAPGSALPDGSRLVGIDGDRMTIALGDCRRVYQLYHAQPISSSTGCPTAPAAAKERKATP